MSATLANAQSGSVGIVIPAYKEADNIANLIREILKHAPGANVIVVDDSPDPATKEAVEKLALPNATVVHRTEKGGRGSAVLVGVKKMIETGCSQVLEMDADFSHPPSQIPALLQEARERDLGLLIASRYLPTSSIQNWPLTRRIFSKCSNLLARAVLGVPIVDYTNGYRVYSRAAAETITKTCGKEGKGFIALSEILINLHYRDFKVGETPTVFVNRLRGESSVNFQEIKNAITGLYQIYRLKGRLIREMPGR